MSLPENDQIIHLNVGGQLFSTSRTTLTWIRDTFFTSLLSGRIATVEDDRGAVSFYCFFGSFINLAFAEIY